MRVIRSPLAVVALIATAAASSAEAQQRIATRVPDVRRLDSVQIPRARLNQILGGAGATIRVVRASGVRDLPASAAAVSIVPGDFIFRKMADSAVKVPAGRSPASGSPTTPNPAPVNPAPASPTTANPPKPYEGAAHPTTAKPTTVKPVSASPAPQVLGADTYAMPYRWMTVDSAGVVRVLAPYFVLIGGRLAYDPASRMYRGTALVGVEDTLHQEAGPVTLIRPLKLQLTTTTAGSVSPVQLEIAHTSLDYATVRIESPDSTHIRIKTGADPVGITIPIPVQDIKVGLTPQVRAIQGFGLATTDISVALPRGMARTDTVSVTFSSTSAPVRPAKVLVAGAEGASVRLRSGRLGPNRIDAFIDGAPAGSTTVTSVAPVAFTVATLVGLVLGGLARFYGATRRKKAKALIHDLLKGAPFGAIAAVASAVGLDLLHLKIDEGGALPAIVITAAIGAWLGAKVLDRSPTS